MEAVIRIEIVIDAAHTPELLKALRKIPVPGFTVVRDVQGFGDRGERGGDELTDIFRNCYVIVATPEEKVDAIIKAVRPLLQSYGGMCLVNEARLLKH